MHIIQCESYALISEGVGVGGTSTISGIHKDLAVVAAASACPTVDCAPTQLCSSQSQGSSGSQLLKKPKCNPRYCVQCCLNSGSSKARPPCSLAMSVKDRFQGKKMSDCFQKYTSRGTSSKDAVSTASIHSMAFKRSGSKAR